MCQWMPKHTNKTNILVHWQYAALTSDCHVARFGCHLSMDRPLTETRRRPIVDSTFWLSQHTHIACISRAYSNADMISSQTASRRHLSSCGVLPAPASLSPGRNLVASGVANRLYRSGTLACTRFGSLRHRPFVQWALPSLRKHDRHKGKQNPLSIMTKCPPTRVMWNQSLTVEIS
jgi:hypothetical protein